MRHTSHWDRTKYLYTCVHDSATCVVGYMCGGLHVWSIACQASRTIWLKPRSPSFLTEIAGSWSDRELKQNFHVGRATINLLSRELKCFLQRQHVVAE